MYYVGSHKGSVNDGYVGSGKRFKFAYKKRSEAFEREILYTGEHYQEVEDLILKTLDVENDDKSYNLKAIGWGGCKKGIKRSEETKRKMSENRIGIEFSDSAPSKHFKIAYWRLPQKASNQRHQNWNRLRHYKRML
jgi:hypothetical protein